MPSLTYRRMADIAAWCKLKPRFCEVDPDSLALSSESIKACITDETALILAVHPIVNCCDVEGIELLGKAQGIPVLFDGVESAYESIAIGKVGAFGSAECFSMHASKLLNGFEGGYITTNSLAVASQLKALRSFGFTGRDCCQIPNGLNAKLNEIHAAMALSNLDEIDTQVVKNRTNYKCYQGLLESVGGVRLLEFDESFDTSYKNIVVELMDDWPLSRDVTVNILNSENILARAYYSPPLHQKKMIYPHVVTSLKLTDYLSERFLLLPCGDFVDVNDIRIVVGLLVFMSVHAQRLNSLFPLQEIGTDEF